MCPAAVTEVDEAGAAPLTHGGAIDEQALDAQQPVRQMDHPFSHFCKAVREACGLPDSQRAREVTSEVCGMVSRLTEPDPGEVEAQAKHIAEMVSEDRKAMKDPQLWLGPAQRIAEHALRLRLEGKAPIADNVQG